MIETIAAVSTANGPGAIGIVRVSGPQTLAICKQVISRNQSLVSEDFILTNEKNAIFCDFVLENQPIDEIIFIFSKGPHSYTGEDLCEFHFHGNPILLKKSLSHIFTLGARPAQNGEFTKRAFLNGKLNLTKAEAIARLIESKSRVELELAQKNVFGRISQLSSKLRSDLISLKAECEAEIDFSTEDLTYESLEDRKSRILSVINLTKETLNSSKRAEKLVSQSSVVLFGEPNTGKSSLMNIILGKDRSIISEIPGTTRDFIAEEISLGGLPIRLIDTAGVRETQDVVEKMGIARSLKEVKSANLRIILVDGANPFNKEKFFDLHKDHLEGSVIVVNKFDCLHETWRLEDFKKLAKESGANALPISCKTGEGIAQLLSLISAALSQGESGSDLVLLEERQTYHLEQIQKNCLQALSLMTDNAPAEIVIEEINNALQEVGEINGQVSTEEVLGRIFSKFCVGK